VVIIWWLFTKIVKRIELFRRNPSNIVFLPVSILFGFCHGIIKLTALWTWNVTSWGNRPDGDIDDSERMSPRVLPAEVMANPTASSKVLIRYTDEAPCTSEKVIVQESVVELVD